MQVVAIIQARMGSTRLPGKVLRDIGGNTMLARVVARVQRASLLDQIIIATTIEPADQAIVAECERLGVVCFQGSEEDVLDRYYQAAKTFDVDVVVRITSDCPLIEPAIVDQVITTFHETEADYVSNTLSRTFPRGLDSEVFKVSVLKQTWQKATKSYQRSHVTPYIYQNPDLFQLVEITSDINYSQHRWTVDTLADWQLVAAIYEHFAPQTDFDWQDILHLLKRQPQLQAINADIEQKELQQG